MSWCLQAVFPFNLKQCFYMFLGYESWHRVFLMSSNIVYAPTNVGRAGPLLTTPPCSFMSLSILSWLIGLRWCFGVTGILDVWIPLDKCLICSPALSTFVGGTSSSWTLVVRDVVSLIEGVPKVKRTGHHHKTMAPPPPMMPPPPSPPWAWKNSMRKN